MISVENLNSNGNKLDPTQILIQEEIIYDIINKYIKQE